PQSFYAVAEAFAEEAEGGKRCESCFKLRLIKTAETASLFNFDTFTTTLTVSPHKDYGAISAIAKKIAVSYGVGFLDMDFKKKAGFQRSIALSKKYDLYRQRYCGCEYSKPEEE
ncbi:MAG: epoxyqueuosine reductase QueH, partial [Anaerovoracaceae bacterium]